MHVTPHEPLAQTVREHFIRLRSETDQQAAAAALLADFRLREWPAALKNDPSLRATPVLQHVLDCARVALDDDATLALRLTTAALAHVPADATVLRARALTTLAQAHRAKSDGTGAQAAIQEAIQLLDGNPLGTTQLQSARMVAALLANDAGEHDLAIQYLDDAIRSCAAEGNARGLLMGGLLQAAFLYENKEFARAARLYDSLLPVAEGLGDERERARIILNRGHCARDLKRVDEALRAYAAALPLYQALGMGGDAQKIVWGIAKLLRDRGQTDAALSTLTRAREEFVERGMILEAGVLSLDMLHLLVLKGNRQRVANLAGELVLLFTNARMPAHLVAAVTHLASARHSLDGPMIARARKILDP